VGPGQADGGNLPNAAFRRTALPVVRPPLSPGARGFLEDWRVLAIAPEMGVRGVIKVQLIDRHEVVRAGVRRLLEGEKGIQVVAESGTVQEGVRDLSARHPNVVIMDVATPSGDDLEGPERIQALEPAVRVIVLTMHDNEVLPVRALKSGARGFLTKACRPEDLVRAVRVVAGGEVYLEPRVAQALALRPFSPGADPLEVLTERELDVFCMLAEGRGVKEIAADRCLSPKTVGACRTRIMKALEADNVADLAHIAIRHGLVRV
jgi:two-component system invasion response regulator UvrY